MEISSLIRKQEFFQAIDISVLLYGCTIWILMEHMNKSYMKIKQEFCVLFRAVPNKAVTVRLHASHLKIQTNKTNQTCWTLNLLVTFSKGFLHLNTPMLADQRNLHYLCIDNEFSLENLPLAIDDTSQWQQTVMGHRAISTTWYYIYHTHTHTSKVYPLEKFRNSYSILLNFKAKLVSFFFFFFFSFYEYISVLYIPEIKHYLVINWFWKLAKKILNKFLEILFFQK